MDSTLPSKDTMNILLDEPGPADNSDRKLFADVAKHGLHVAHIPQEAVTPGWSFSIGLYRSHGSPEVVVFGLDMEVAHPLVNELGCRASLSPLEAGQIHTGLVDGFDCVLKPVDPVWYRPFLGRAQWYYRRRPYPVLQCFWPDRAGNYPWEDSFDDRWRYAQPLLYMKSPEAAGAKALLNSMADAG